MDAATILSTLKTALPGATVEVAPAGDRPTLVVAREHLLDVCRTLRDGSTLRFTVLTDMTAVDVWPDEPRFTVVYHVLSPDLGGVLRLKVRLGGAEAHVPTVSEIWPSAGWLEREVWDLFGIAFDGHPDLRRLMMPEDWEGHPLRKDYPVQIRMAPKVFEPLQLSPEEFQARLEADRYVRRKPGDAGDTGSQGRGPAEPGGGAAE